jgi:hypothetical protein
VVEESIVCVDVGAGIDFFEGFFEKVVRFFVISMVLVLLLLLLGIGAYLGVI